MACRMYGTYGVVNMWINLYMVVSKNSGTPKSSILIGFAIINHQFWGIPIIGNTHISIYDMTTRL